MKAKLAATAMECASSREQLVVINKEKETLEKQVETLSQSLMKEQEDLNASRVSLSHCKHLRGIHLFPVYILLLVDSFLKTYFLLRTHQILIMHLYTVIISLLSNPAPTGLGTRLQ